MSAASRTPVAHASASAARAAFWRIRAEIRATLAALADWRLALLLVLLPALLTLAALLPLRYTVQIGQPDGVGADEPLVARFYGADEAPAGPFRWSGARSLLRMPGFGGRPLPVALRILPVTPEILASGPQVVELWSGERLVAPLPIRLSGATYRLLLPPHAGPHSIELRSATFRTPDDERDLGAPVSTLTVWRAGLAWPDPGSTAAWMAGLALLWLAVRRTGWGSEAAALMALLLAGSLTVAAALDPPRTALAAEPFARAFALAWAVGVALRTLAPALFRRAGVPLDVHTLRWLLLMAMGVFVLRYGGKAYPGAMPGDIGFHTNRFGELVAGQIFLSAPHRGVVAPYPPALYLLLAPLSLAGPRLRALLVATPALLDTLSPFVVYMIARAGLGRSARRPALLAAGFYALAPGGLLALWWSFSTHIFAQFAHLALVAALVLMLRSPGDPTAGMARRGLPAATLVCLVALQCLVYLGHFSYYLNASLLLSGCAGLVLLLGLLGRLERGAALRLALAGIIAQAVCALLFFSVFVSDLRGQASAVEAGAASGVLLDSQALAAFIGSILGEGLRDHIGLFPAVLALAGVGLFSAGYGKPGGALRALAGGTLLIALIFAALPLFSGANLTTRWLMFSLWAVGVAGALAGQRLWRAGQAGRVLMLAIGLYIAWVSATIWVAAMAWRIRPPEPF